MGTLTFRGSLPRAFPLCAVLGLLAATGCSAGQRQNLAAPSAEVRQGGSDDRPQNLFGPVPKVGEVDRDEMTITMTNGQITITAGGMSQTGQVDMRMHGIHEEEILAVVDGRVTSSRTKVVTDQVTETLRAEGQTDTHTDRSPLEGETVECAKVGEGWKNTLVGKVPTPEQALELKLFLPPESGLDIYPLQPVQPGHTWNVDIAKMKKFLGGVAQLDSGNWKMTFEKMIDVGGESCAQIAEEIELRARKRNEKGEWETVELKAVGTTHRSLRLGLDVSTTLTGTLTLSRTVTAGGERLELTIRGEVTIESRGIRK